MRATAPKKLVDSVSRRTAIDTETVKLILETAFEDIKTTASTSKVVIRGFGVFHTATRKGCTRESPLQPGKMVTSRSSARLALRSPPTYSTK